MYYPLAGWAVAWLGVLCATVVCTAWPAHAIAPAEQDIKISYEFDAGQEAWGNHSALSQGAVVTARAGDLWIASQQPTVRIQGPLMAVPITNYAHVVTRIRYTGADVAAAVLLRVGDSVPPASFIQNPAPWTGSGVRRLSFTLRGNTGITTYVLAINGSHGPMPVPLLNITQMAIELAVPGGTMQGKLVRIQWLRVVEAPAIARVVGCSKLDTGTAEPTTFPRWEVWRRPTAMHTSQYFATEGDTHHLRNRGSLDATLPWAATYDCSLAGGDVVTVSGRFFGLDTPHVLVDSRPCTNVVMTVPQRELTCRVPPGSGTLREVAVYNARMQQLYDGKALLSYMVGPSPPPGIVASNIAAHAVDVSWFAPTDLWDALATDGYRVQWRKEARLSDIMVNGSLPADYLFDVAASGQKLVPPGVNVVTGAVDRNALAPGSPWDRVSDLYLRYSEGGWEQWGSADGSAISTLGNVTTTTIIGLDPYTRYQFRVAAVTEDPAGNSTREVDMYGRRTEGLTALSGAWSTPSSVEQTLAHDFVFPYFTANFTLNHGAIDKRSSISQLATFGGEGHYGLVLLGAATVGNCNATSTCCDDWGGLSVERWQPAPHFWIHEEGQRFMYPLGSGSVADNQAEPSAASSSSSGSSTAATSQGADFVRVQSLAAGGRAPGVGRGQEVLQMSGALHKYYGQHTPALAWGDPYMDTEVNYTAAFAAAGAPHHSLPPGAVADKPVKREDILGVLLTRRRTHAGDFNFRQPRSVHPAYPNQQSEIGGMRLSRMLQTEQGTVHPSGTCSLQCVAAARLRPPYLDGGAVRDSDTYPLPDAALGMGTSASTLAERLSIAPEQRADISWYADAVSPFAQNGGGSYAPFQPGQFSLDKVGVSVVHANSSTPTVATLAAHPTLSSRIGATRTPPNVLIAPAKAFHVNATAPCGAMLRLTPAATQAVGAAWYPRQQAVREGFDTRFAVRLSSPSPKCKVHADEYTYCRYRGGHGFAFVVQNFGAFALGAGGAGLGYAGIRNSLAVEFDTYLDGALFDPGENHISVHTRGSDYPNSANHTHSLGQTVQRLPDLTDGILTVRILYEPRFDAAQVTNTPDNSMNLAAFTIPHQMGEISVASSDTTAPTYFSTPGQHAAASGTSNPVNASALPAAEPVVDLGDEDRPPWLAGLGTLSIFLNDAATPVLAVPLNLGATLALNNGRAWVGFTAATGDEVAQATEVLAWEWESLRSDTTL